MRKSNLFFVTFIIVFCLSACILTACSGKKIMLDKTNVTANVNETVTLTATVKNILEPVVWKSSDESVATVKDGIVTPKKAGTVTITATAGGISAECVITFLAETSISLDKTNVSVIWLETVNLTATKINITEPTEWSTSDASIATVQDGMVTALKPGTVTITARAGGKSATCVINFMEPGANDKLEIVCGYLNINLFEGESKTVSPYVTLNGTTELQGGEFTYEISDENIATVTSEGLINAVSKGEVSLTVNGEIKGYTLAPCIITVTVNEKVELILTDEDGRATIYSNAGTSGTFATAYTIGYTLKINGTITDKGTVEFVNKNEDVVSISGNVVTAKAVGTALIEIVYTSEKNTTVKTEFYVVVEKPFSALNLSKTVVLGNYNEIDFTQFGINDAVTKIQLGGNNVVYNLENNKLSFPNHDAPLGYGISMQIETENEIFSTTVTVTDYAIGSKADFTAFGRAISANNSINGILTSNIDYENENFFTNSGFYTSKPVYYSGTLDGNGYTVYNIKGNNGIFYGFKSATIKNIAFLNVLRDTPNGGGMLANESLGTTTIENVYIQGKFTAYKGGYLGGLMGMGTGTYKNVVAVIDFASNPNTYPAFYCDMSYPHTSITDCYVISSNSNGYMYNNVTDGLYTSMAAFNADAAELKTNFSDDYWAVVKGTLIFKSAADIIDLIVPMIESISITNTESQVFIGQELTLTSSENTNVTYSLKTPVTGVTINGNKLQIGNGAASGSTVTVVATYTHPFFAQQVVAEKTFTIYLSENIDVTDSVLVAKNRDDFSYDLTSYNFSTVVNAKFNNLAIAFDFSNGILTIEKEAFATVAATLTINAISSNTYYSVNIPVEVVDYAIGTKEELAAFGAGAASASKAILTDNIDFEGGMLAGGSCDFFGTFDGRGYTISNISGTHGIFANISKATIKNTAFVNVSISNYGGLLALGPDPNLSNFGVAVVDNVYIQGFAANEGENFAGLIFNCYAKISNTVIVIDFGNSSSAVARPVVGWSWGGATTLTNVYGVSANSSGVMLRNGVASDDIYTTADAFNVEAAAIQAAMNSEYWTLEDGVLVLRPIAA